MTTAESLPPGALQAWAVACDSHDGSLGRGVAHGFTVLLQLLQEFDKAVEEENE